MIVRRPQVDTLSAVVIACAVVWLIVTAIPATIREGFSADEEVTALVVSSSSLAGLPVLPSGVMYPRGLLYVKLAELAGAAATPALPTYRVVSLLFGLGNVVLIALVARLWMMPAAAPVASVLLATSPLHVAMSTFARPYTAGIFFFLLATLAISRASKSARGEWWFLMIAAVAQTVHEAGILLVLMPVACAAILDTGDPRRRRAAWLFVKTVVVVCGLQLFLGAGFSASVSARLGTVNGALAVFVVRAVPWPSMDVPALAGPAALCAAVGLASGLALLLRRLTRLFWIELILGATLATLFLLGPLLAATLLGMFAQPSRVRAYGIAGLAFNIASAVGWTVHTAIVTDAALSWPLGVGLARSSLAYPFGWVWLLAQQFPLAASAVVVTCLIGAYAQLPERRFTGVLAWLIALMLGLLQIVGHDRYVALVMPLIFMLAAVAVVEAGRLIGSLVSSGTIPWAAPGAAALTICTLTGALFLEQRAYARRPDTETDLVASRYVGTSYAPSTYFADQESRACIAAISTSDILVCNDELACRFLLGRVDAWLLPQPELRAVCAVERDGVSRGIYVGSRVLESRDALAHFISANATRSVTVAILGTPKFGYSEQGIVTRQLADERGVVARSCGSDGLVFRFDR